MRVNPELLGELISGRTETGAGADTTDSPPAICWGTILDSVNKLLSIDIQICNIKRINNFKIYLFFEEIIYDICCLI